MLLKSSAALIALSLAVSPLAAQADAFQAGPVFTEFGRHAPVETTMEIPADASFAVVLETSDRTDAGEINDAFASAASFINMHVAAGVAPENIRVAIVVYGLASLDLTRQEFYAEHRDGGENGNVSAIEALLANNVRIILCGQSAAYYQIGLDDLLPGVEVALSAMTAHALLQQEGYTLNP